jgi:hypothetical protein
MFRTMHSVQVCVSVACVAVARHEFLFLLELPIDYSNWARSGVEIAKNGVEIDVSLFI